MTKAAGLVKGLRTEPERMGEAERRRGDAEFIHFVGSEQGITAFEDLSNRDCQLDRCGLELHQGVIRSCSVPRGAWSEANVND